MSRPISEPESKDNDWYGNDDTDSCICVSFSLTEQVTVEVISLSTILFARYPVRTSVGAPTILTNIFLSFHQTPGEF